MMEQNHAINQIGERVDSVRDEANVLTSQTIPSTVTTQSLATLQQENQALQTALTVSEAWGTQNNNPNPPGWGGGGGRGVGERGGDHGERVTDDHQASLELVPTKKNA